MEMTIHSTMHLPLKIAAYAGIVFFAATGVLASARRNMDAIGAIVLAIVTATGGGTLRDVLDGQLPVFWIQDTMYLWAAAGTALLMLPLMPHIRFPERALHLPDSLGLSLYTWLGCEKVFNMGLPSSVVVVLGVTTGIAGGLLRDILSAQVPEILKRGELNASASFAGAVLYVVIRNSGAPLSWAAGVCFATVMVLRFAALRWNLMLPEIKSGADR